MELPVPVVKFLKLNTCQGLFSSKAMSLTAGTDMEFH